LEWVQLILLIAYLYYFYIVKLRER